MGFLSCGIPGRKTLWLGVTAHPSAEWKFFNRPKLAVGANRHGTSFVIAMAHMARLIPGYVHTDLAFFGRGQDDRHGSWLLVAGASRSQTADVDECQCSFCGKSIS